jgi:hypothetical protein
MGSSDLDTVRKEYQPARMRERCGDGFRSAEYSSHCQVGDTQDSQPAMFSRNMYGWVLYRRRSYSQQLGLT